MWRERQNRLLSIVAMTAAVGVAGPLATSGSARTTAAAGSGRTTIAAGSGRTTIAAGRARTTIAAGSGRTTAAAGSGRTTVAAGRARTTIAAGSVRTTAVGNVWGGRSFTAGGVDALVSRPDGLLGPCSPVGCPSAGAAPSVAFQDPSTVGASSVTLQGTIDPDGLATSYTFEYAPSATPTQLLQTPANQLGSGVVPQNVTATITGLTPETNYAVALIATNSQGSRSDSGEFDTSAPAMPPLGVGRPTVGHAVLPMGATVRLAARVTGPLGFYRTYFGAPSAHLESDPPLPALTLPGISDASVDPSGLARFLPVTPLRNTRFRVRVGANVGPWRLIYVQPITDLYATPDPLRIGAVDLEYTAAGTLPDGYRRGPVAYFYRATRRSGPFLRIASAVFKRTGVSLSAHLKVLEPPGGFYEACTRGRIIPDMGRPFHDARCGNLSLL